MSPLLARPGSSLIQLFLATFPLFAVLVYFLYVASIRHTLPEYNIDDRIDDDGVIADIIASEGPQIALMEMNFVFLTVFFIWSILGIYLAVFVPKRRELVSSYLTEAYILLGDVRYDDPKTTAWCCSCCLRCLPRFASYGYVTYAHPIMPDDGYSIMGTTINTGADSYSKGAETANTTKSSSPPTSKRWLVQKRVRTYAAYDRELVAIAILPDYPLSGQPKGDVEVDVASFTEESRDRIRDIITVIQCWIAFCLFGAVYIIFQMHRIDDEYDDPRNGWIVFGAFLLAVPIVAFGGNWIRWILYRRWLLHGGNVIERGDLNSRSIKSSILHKERDDEDTQGMSTVMEENDVDETNNVKNGESAPLGMIKVKRKKKKSSNQQTSADESIADASELTTSYVSMSDGKSRAVDHQDGHSQYSM